MLNATIELLKKQYGFTDETIKLYNQAILMQKMNLKYMMK